MSRLWKPNGNKLEIDGLIILGPREWGNFYCHEVLQTTFSHKTLESRIGSFLPLNPMSKNLKCDIYQNQTGGAEKGKF